MARALKMLCGSQCVEWRQVLDFVRQSQIVWPEIVALEKLRVAQQGQKDDPNNCLPASPTLTDDLIADGFELKPLIPDPNKRPALGATIIRTRHSLATDERDKVYGLLGLCDDSKWLVPRPSYRIPAARVFFGVVRNYILWEFRDTGYQYLLRELPLNHELWIDSEWKTNWVDVSIGLPHLFQSETGNPWVPMQPMFRDCFPACHGDFEVSTWCTLVRDSPLDVESQQTIEDHKSKKVPSRPSENAAIECENAQRKKPKDSRRISSRSKPEDHIDRWPSLSFSGLRTHLLVKETITSTTHDSQPTSAGGARDPGPEGYDVGLLIDPSEARNVINRFLSAFIDWSHCAWWTSEWTFEERTTAYAFTSLCLESKWTLHSHTVSKKDLLFKFYNSLHKIQNVVYKERKFRTWVEAYARSVDYTQQILVESSSISGLFLRARLSSKFKSVVTTQVSDARKEIVRAFASRLIYESNYRDLQLVIGNKGFIGWASPQVRRGDQICRIRWGRNCLILRPESGGYLAIGGIDPHNLGWYSDMRKKRRRKDGDENPKAWTIVNIR